VSIRQRPEDPRGLGGLIRTAATSVLRAVKRRLVLAHAAADELTVSSESEGGGPAVVALFCMECEERHRAAAYLIGRDFLLAAVVLIPLAGAVYAPHIARSGFYYDDWANAADYWAGSKHDVLTGVRALSENVGGALSSPWRWRFHMPSSARGRLFKSPMVLSWLSSRRCAGTSSSA